MDFPENFERAETEYYMHHDPYAEIYCEECSAETKDLCICNDEWCEENLGEGEID